MVPVGVVSIMMPIKEEAYKWIAYKLPKLLVTWVTYRLLVHASSGKWCLQDLKTLTMDEVMERWEQQMKNKPGIPDNPIINRKPGIPDNPI